MAQSTHKTMPILSEQCGPPAVRIVRAEAGRGRPTVFQPEWTPAFCPDHAAPDRRRGRAPGRNRRLTARYFDLAKSVALSASVSAFVTLVLTIRAVGLAPDWTETWLTTLQLSLLIGLPARFFLEPHVARVVGLFVEPPGGAE